MKIPAVYWISSSAVAVIGALVMAAGFVQMKNNQGGISETIEQTGIESIHTELPRCGVQLSVSEEAEHVTVELKNVPATVKVFSENGTLYVTDAAWNNLIFFSLGSDTMQTGEIIITVPPQEYGDVLLSSGFGKQNTVSGIQAESLQINAGAGNWLLEQMEADTMKYSSGAGNLSMNNVHVLKKAELDGGAGASEMKDCTFGTLAYSQGAGDLNGSGITVQESFIMESGAGNCTLDGCTLAGETLIDIGMGDVTLNNLQLFADMEISCGAGDLTLGILGRPDEYTVDCSDHVGNTSILGNSGINYMNGSKYHITIDGVGNADVSFIE